MRAAASRDTERRRQGKKKWDVRVREETEKTEREREDFLLFNNLLTYKRLRKEQCPTFWMDGRETLPYPAVS